MSRQYSQKPRLKISEIFYSLQGEARNVGLPTVFIRLTGCPLRCHYCDTAYAFSGGEWMDVESIIKQVQSFKTMHVTVTGGEPLAQKDCIELLTQLCDRDYDVSLETSGAIAVEQVDQRVVKVLDVKTPGSGEESKNRIENFSCLNEHDQIKFVICDLQDYQWSKAVLEQYPLDNKCEILFSPVASQLPAATLANWILEDRLNVRLQIQLHKYLWGDVQGV